MALTLRNRPLLLLSAATCCLVDFNAVVTELRTGYRAHGRGRTNTSIALATTFVVALATFPLAGRITQVVG